MSVPLQPQIVVKGGQDLDGSWGPAKTFAREFYFELFNVPLPMYLDGNGFMLYPDPNTGKVNTTLSPKVQGYVYKPMFFSALHFPIV